MVYIKLQVDEWNQIFLSHIEVESILIKNKKIKKKKKKK